MSSRRQPAPRSGRPSAANNAPSSTALPDYQPPQRPLTLEAKEKIEALGSSNDDAKYLAFLKNGITYLSNAIADTSEMLEDQKKKLHQLEEKRESNGSQMTDFEEKMRDSVNKMEAKLEEYIVNGEKAVRELVDYEVEIGQRAEVIQSVLRKINAAPVPAPRQASRRARNADAEGEDEDSQNERSESEEQSVPVLKPLELFKEAQDGRKAQYEAKSLRDRYTQSNHYVQFRRTVHVSRHGDVDMPSKENWFNENGADFSVPQENVNDDESDEDFVVQSATVNTKCPLSMMTLTQPYSNEKCVHVYEKEYLIQYIQQTGTAYPKGGRGPKQVKCVVPGCDAVSLLQSFNKDLLHHCAPC